MNNLSLKTPAVTRAADLGLRMTETSSDFLLVCQATSIELNQGQWRFSLESADGEFEFEATDTDIGDLNRLTLLAAVRGLEAIEGASAVTLLSNNRYLIRSLSDSLPRWRVNNFAWEHFGRRIDVQHADLWRRVDRALSIHRVEACLISSRLVSGPGHDRIDHAWEAQDDIQVRIDGPHRELPAPRHANKPKDQLRRWLLSGASALGSTPAQNRFTAADLVGAAN